MGKFKISIFEEEHKDVFPSYRTLSDEECEKLRLQLIKKYNIGQENMVYELFSKQYCYADEDASEDFNLINTLSKLGIIPAENIYIDWYNFERIDLIATKHLSNFFYDIWYPVADDMNIFDQNLDWLIYIRYDGAIYYIR